MAAPTTWPPCCCPAGSAPRPRPVRLHPLRRRDRRRPRLDPGPGRPGGRPAGLGERFFAGLRGAPRRPGAPGRAPHRAAFDLDPSDFERFLDSMAMDLHTDGYRTYDDLCYMEGSAAVIGTMMAPILESADPPAAREHARQLGLAFQLTNFIRDLAEDHRRGRVYLPAADLERFGVRRATWPPPRPPRQWPSCWPSRSPGPGPTTGRRAGHRAARPLLPAVCPGRLRALRRHPGRGRAGRLPGPGPPGPGSPATAASASPAATGPPPTAARAERRVSVTTPGAR